MTIKLRAAMSTNRLVTSSRYTRHTPSIYTVSNNDTDTLWTRHVTE